FPRRLDADYVRQLTAERVVTRFERGRPIRSWQPKRDGERNEALDCRVYARAAAWIAGADRWPDEKWRDLEDQLGTAPTDDDP
ncbi:hypothetical protein RCK87_26580, partial [Salmonella enterica subsp. enterica serovar 1,4,[5],12:i:-]